MLDVDKITRCVASIVGRVQRGDVTQDVLVWFLQHREEPVTWTMVRWRALDALRTLNRHRCVELLDSDVTTVDRDPLVDVDIDQLIKRACLSNDEQLLLYYRFTQGMSIQDMSVRTGVERTRVAAQLSNVLSKLRQETDNE